MKCDDCMSKHFGFKTKIKVLCYWLTATLTFDKAVLGGVYFVIRSLYIKLGDLM